MKRVRRKPQNNNKGFSLIEVLVTMLIISIVCVPLIRSFVTSANVNKKARRIQNATDVAQSVAEYFANNPMDDLENLVDEDDYSSIVDSDGNDVITYSNVKDWRSSTAAEYFQGAGGERFYVDVTMSGRDEEYTVPDLKDFYGNSSVLCMYQIYKYDKEAVTRLKGDDADGSGIRKSSDLYIEIDGDTYNYYVTVTYAYGSSYYTTEEMVLGTGTIDEDSDEFPSIFMAYEPYDKTALSDLITVHYDNSALDKRSVNLYIVQQSVTGADGSNKWMAPSNVIVEGSAQSGLIRSDISSFKENNVNASLSVESNIIDFTGSSVTAGSGQRLKLYDISVSVKYGSAEGEVTATVSTLREELIYD